MLSILTDIFPLFCHYQGVKNIRQLFDDRVLIVSLFDQESAPLKRTARQTPAVSTKKYFPLSTGVAIAMES